MSLTASTTPRMPSISIRLDPRTIVRLEREAEADRRPLTQYLRLLIDDALAQRERQARRGSANA
jgi:hypothetical protein